MRLAGHQPNYLPNLAFFAKMAQVETFVVSSNVQFVRDKEFHRRNRVIDADGNEQWLTVPVHGPHRQVFREVLINNELPWREEHAALLRTLYGDTPHQEYLEAVLAVYEKPWKRLVDLTWELIQIMAVALDLKTHLLLDEETGGEREDLLLNTCRRHAATHYVSGVGGRHYMDDQYYQSFSSTGISLSFLSLPTTHPYSAIHYVLTEGPAWVQEQLDASELVTA